MPAKCTVFYEAHGNGWSETYWHSATSLSTARDAFRTLLTARTLLSPATVKVKAIRISDSAEQRFTIRDTPTGNYAEGRFDSFDEEASYVNLTDDAVLIEIEATPRYKNRIYLRGMVDQAIKSALAGQDTAWLAAFKTGPTSFVETYLNNQFRVRNWNPVAGTYQYTTPLAVSIITATTRRTGRPFGQRVGRRKTPKSQSTPAG